MKITNKTPNTATHAVGTQIKSSSGGAITYTKTGLIHKCGRNYNTSNVAHAQLKKIKD